MSAVHLLPEIVAGRVLVVGTPPRGAEPDATRFDVEAPPTVGALRGALAEPHDLFDAALICDWGRDVAPRTSSTRRVARSAMTGGSRSWRRSRGAGGAVPAGR